MARLTPQKKRKVGQSSGATGKEERLGQEMVMVTHSEMVSHSEKSSSCLMLGHSLSPVPWSALLQSLQAAIAAAFSSA